MGFRNLRVINDDRVAAGQGFGTHGHDNMEIISFVIDGAMEHRDSTGTRGVVGAGDVQRMTAGRGIVHAEMPKAGGDNTGLQLWCVPA